MPPIELTDDQANLDSKIKKDINLYLSYLKKLQQVCDEHRIEFAQADRILYSLDQQVNKGHKITY